MILVIIVHILMMISQYNMLDIKKIKVPFFPGPFMKLRSTMQSDSISSPLCDGLVLKFSLFERVSQCPHPPLPPPSYGVKANHAVEYSVVNN